MRNKNVRLIIIMYYLQNTYIDEHKHSDAVSRGKKNHVTRTSHGII